MLLSDVTATAISTWYPLKRSENTENTRVVWMVNNCHLISFGCLFYCQFIFDKTQMSTVIQVEANSAESTPLLQTPAVSIVTDLRNTSQKSNIKLRILIVTSVFAVIVALLLAYSTISYIPAKIQASVDGNGASISRIAVKSIQNQLVTAMVTLDFPVESSPVNVDILTGPLILKLQRDAVRGVDFAVSNLPALNIPANTQRILQTYQSETLITNMAELAWLIRAGIKYGTDWETSFEYDAFPVFRLPFGNYIAHLHKKFVFPANSSYEFDTNYLNASTSGIEFESIDLPQGTEYHISAIFNFDNPFEISLDSQSMNFSASIIFKSVPILSFSIIDPMISIGVSNAVRFKVDSIARYSAELMEFVGMVAAGEDTPVNMHDLCIYSYSGKLSWIQDLIDGLSIPFKVPGAKDGLLDLLQGLLNV